MLERMNDNNALAVMAAYIFIAMVLSAIVTAVICLFLNMFVMPFFKSKAVSIMREKPINTKVYLSHFHRIVLLFILSATQEKPR